MAVILIGIAGVVGSLTFGLRASSHGEMLTDASNHARMLIECMVGRDYISRATALTPKSGSAAGNWPTAASGLNDAGPVALDAPPFDENPDIYLDTATLHEFTRQVTCERRGSASGDPDEFLANVTVRIFWEEKGVQKSVTMSAVIPHTLEI